MTSAVRVKPGFRLAELDLERRLADEASYQQNLRKLQIAMLELEEIYRVERRRGIVERVEGLARPEEWRRAYDEINAFEKMLVKALGKEIALRPPPLDPEVVTAATEIPGRKKRAALGFAEPELTKS